MSDVLTKLAQRFEIAEDGCWNWTGSLSTYGRFYAGDGRTTVAHRAVWLAVVGPVEVGLELDHLCRNTACVNPDHLEPVTPQENVRRADGWAGLNYRKTRCDNGHPFDEANTHIDYRGRRKCRACQTEQQADRRAKFGRRIEGPRRRAVCEHCGKDMVAHNLKRHLRLVHADRLTTDTP